MRKCCVCKKELPDSEFNKHKGHSSGYVSRCKECHKKYMHQYRKKNLTALKTYDRERDLRGKIVNDIVKITVGCCICGYKENPLALEWHHLKGKDEDYLNISGSAVGHYSMERILKELNKCVLLCCNCHKIITILERDNQAE